MITHNICVVAVVPGSVMDPYFLFPCFTSDYIFTHTSRLNHWFSLYFSFVLVLVSSLVSSRTIQFPSSLFLPCCVPWGH